jgi:hypothetical protein
MSGGKKIGYSNRVAYVLKCTVRRPVVFYLWRQRATAELGTCISSLPPHPNSYSRNIAYLVSSREQEAVIAADQNRQSGSNGGGDGDGDGNGDGDSGKEDDEGDSGCGNSNGDCDSNGSDDEDNGGDRPVGGTNNNQQNKENVAAKAAAAVRW